jgi:type VI secretion system secreted protein VgrG
MTTPLGPDVLLLTAFAGEVEMSRPFNYKLEMLSQKDDVAAADIVGKSVSWKVQPVGGSARVFHGFSFRPRHVLRPPRPSLGTSVRLPAG